MAGCFDSEQDSYAALRPNDEWGTENTARGVSLVGHVKAAYGARDAVTSLQIPHQDQVPRQMAGQTIFRVCLSY